MVKYDDAHIFAKPENVAIKNHCSFIFCNIFDVLITFYQHLNQPTEMDFYLGLDP